MGLFRFLRKDARLDGIHLAEEFSSQERIPAPYPVAMDGIELSERNLESVFQEFLEQSRGLVVLYIPREEDEERRELLLQEVARHSLSLAELDRDEEVESFLRSYTSVRFGFQHQNYNYVFESTVLGKIEADDPVILAEKPQKIFQERRSYQRYKVWPDHQAFFWGMQVMDISQAGMKVFSEQRLDTSQALERAILSLPQVQESDSGKTIYGGGEVEIPHAVITHGFKQHHGFYYGINFDQELPDEDKKKLNDFLLALRKLFLQMESG